MKIPSNVRITWPFRIGPRTSILDKPAIINHKLVEKMSKKTMTTTPNQPQCCCFATNERLPTPVLNELCPIHGSLANHLNTDLGDKHPLKSIFSFVPMDKEKENVKNVHVNKGPADLERVLAEKKSRTEETKRVIKMLQQVLEEDTEQINDLVEEIRDLRTQVVLLNPSTWSPASLTVSREKSTSAERPKCVACNGPAFWKTVATTAGNVQALACCNPMTTGCPR
jgi:hypothetical protein